LPDILETGLEDLARCHSVSRLVSHLFDAGNKFKFVLLAVNFDQFHYKSG